jgi:hypothetical protein
MLSLLWRSIRVLTACILAMNFAVPQNLVAQAHVVSALDLQRQAVAASQERQKNLEIVTRCLSSPAAAKAMSISHADAKQVKTAVSNLSDQELARLASRSQKAEADFAAGRMTDHDLLIILIAVVALVLIIVAVHH